MSNDINRYVLFRMINLMRNSIRTLKAETSFLTVSIVLAFITSYSTWYFFALIGGVFESSYKFVNGVVKVFAKSIKESYLIDDLDSFTLRKFKEPKVSRILQSTVPSNFRKVIEATEFHKEDVAYMRIGILEDDVKVVDGKRKIVDLYLVYTISIGDLAIIRCFDGHYLQIKEKKPNLSLLKKIFREDFSELKKVRRDFKRI